MDNSDLKYQISLTLSGTFEYAGPSAEFSKIMKRVCCLAAMHLNKEQKFTKQTQYLIAAILYDKAKVMSKSETDADKVVSFNVKGYTEFEIEDKAQTDSKSICRREHIKYYTDEITPLKITYDLVLNLLTFDESKSKDVMLDGYVTLVPELDDFLIEFFKDLQRQFALIGYYDFEHLKSYICADINTLNGKKFYMQPPFMAKLTAALENKSKTDLNNVD